MLMVLFTKDGGWTIGCVVNILNLLTQPEFGYFNPQLGSAVRSEFSTHYHTNEIRKNCFSSTLNVADFAETS